MKYLLILDTLGEWKSSLGTWFSRVVNSCFDTEDTHKIGKLMKRKNMNQ
jgi:hypothetical protein